MNSPDEPKGLLKARYYETYYFADILSNVLEDPFPYIRKIHEFYEDNEASLLEPFPRYSHFHRFIEFLINDLIFDRLEEFHLDEARERAEKFRGIPSQEAFNWTKPPIERAFDYHGIECQTFRNWLRDGGVAFEHATDDHLYDYYCDLRLTEDYGQLVDAMVEETFFIMFLNRKAMRDFNRVMALAVSAITFDDVPPESHRLLKSDGVLQRRHIPVWARKAVFFRERGKCALTRKDLSGLLSTLNDSHFDHIVPLSAGGLNDVTNLQLLAADTNLGKSNRHDETSMIYERWY